MPPSPFSQLPPEILLLIFSEVSDLHDLNNLRQSSRMCYQIYRSEATTITLTTLPRLIPCIEAAKALVTAQHPELDSLSNRREAAYHRNACLIENSRVADIICEVYRKQSVLSPADCGANPLDPFLSPADCGANAPDPFLSPDDCGANAPDPFLSPDDCGANAPDPFHEFTPAERHCFIQAFHRVCESICMSDCLDRKHRDRHDLNSIDLRSLFLVHELGFWLRRPFFTHRYHPGEDDFARKEMEASGHIRAVGRRAFRQLTDFEWGISNLCTVWVYRMLQFNIRPVWRANRSAFEGLWGFLDGSQDTLDECLRK